MGRSNNSAAFVTAEPLQVGYRWAMSHRSQTVMPRSMAPAAVSRVDGDTRRASHCPSSTPMRLVVTSAVPAPKNTIQGDWD